MTTISDINASEALEALNDLIDAWVRDYRPDLADGVDLAEYDEHLDDAVHAALRCLES